MGTGPRRQLRVLLAEDDYDVRLALAEALRADGYEVVEVANGSCVRELVDDCMLRDCPRPRIDALVTDIRMPRLDGLALLAYLDEIGFSVPAIIITAFGDHEMAETARSLGVLAVLDKPIDVDELERVLGQLTKAA